MNLVHALRRGSSACGGSGPATSTWINAGCPECSRALGDPWPVLRATWTPGEGWRWTCGAEEGRFDARSPSAGVAVDQFRRLLQRWPDGVELEVDGLDEVEHRTLAYLLRFNVGGDDL